MVLLIHAIQYFEIGRIEQDHLAMADDLLVDWKLIAELQRPVIMINKKKSLNYVLHIWVFEWLRNVCRLPGDIGSIEREWSR